VVEHSVYVAAEARGLGVGKALLRALAKSMEEDEKVEQYRPMFSSALPGLLRVIFCNPCRGSDAASEDVDTAIDYYDHGWLQADRGAWRQATTLEASEVPAGGQWNCPVMANRSAH
jgi:GNAT superfamily N-acetyltransferase